MKPGENSDRQLNDWADQYQAELEKQASDRGATVESLLLSGDFNAIREWLELWEEEDKAPDSLRQKYNKTYAKLKRKILSRGTVIDN